MPLDPQIIDPQIKGFLDMLEQAGAPSSFAGAPEEMRSRMEAAITGHWEPSTFAPVASVEEAVVGARSTGVQIVRPAVDGIDSTPTVVFFHPGGFLMGRASLFLDVAQRMSNSLGAVVVSVDYRLAPEHPFPAAVQDAIDVLVWANENIGELGGDPSRLAVAGESSGANLATVAARHMRDRGVPIAAQLLASPFTDMTREYPSVEENAVGLFFTRDDIRVVRSQYLSEPGDVESPDVSPALADLRGVAPAVIGVAGFDPLRDDGTAYAAALLRADVPTQFRSYPALIHPFFGMPGLSPAAERAGDELMQLFLAVINASASATTLNP
ncbi:alpha/beta hydrolase [Herbiconiux ginsengi]|uniref:Acetyl esterase n=1 Tax=Herbiconiux ginsengi TaxID=381665 RepID=A0A1H3TUC4_9MICO|nr:alpha/beta hydrolase [Herbiconiux ginsengi]SDZ53850.1 acetyl esterase [Herbiconiux ginsengi]